MLLREPFFESHLAYLHALNPFSNPLTICWFLFDFRDNLSS